MKSAQCGQMSTPSRTLSLRLKPELTTRLDTFENATGVMGTTLGTKLLEAALDHWEKGGPISFPVHLSFDETRRANMIQAATIAAPQIKYGDSAKKKPA
jgi:hypothetical protein